MKKLILFFLALPSIVFSDDKLILITQRNSNSIGSYSTYPAFPTATTGQAIPMLDLSTQVPGYFTIGSGLTTTNGVLNTSSGVAQVNADWNATNGLAQILNKPALFSGSYTDLSNKPTIPATQINSDYAATSGPAQILNKPTLSAVATSGSYNDLINKPTAIGQVNSDWAATSGSAQILNKPILAPVATSGTYSDLTGKPALFSGAYADLTGKPSIPTMLSSFTNDAGFITSAALSTYATTTALSSGLAVKFTIPTGTTSQYVRGDGTLATLPVLPTLAAVATSGSYTDLLNRPTIPAVPTAVSAFTNDSGYLTSSALAPYATTASVTTGLAAKYNTPAGTTAQYVRGDGSLGTTPAAFNYGAPTSRTLTYATSYQATTNTKAADVTISPQCSATLSLTTGSTCSIEARVSATTATCSSGTVVETWTNGNTGSLTIGLNLTQIIGSPGVIKLPAGYYFILCQTSGTGATITTAVDQTAG